MFETTGTSFNTEGLSRVFPKDFGRVKRLILDPRGLAAIRWNTLFFAAGLVYLFVDPLFLFLPVSQPDLCFETGMSLQIILTIMRTVSDVFYIIHSNVQHQRGIQLVYKPVDQNSYHTRHY